MLSHSCGPGYRMEKMSAVYKKLEKSFALNVRTQYLDYFNSDVG